MASYNPFVVANSHKKLKNSSTTALFLSLCIPQRDPPSLSSIFSLAWLLPGPQGFFCNRNSLRLGKSSLWKSTRLSVYLCESFEQRDIYIQYHSRKEPLFYAPVCIQIHSCSEHDAPFYCLLDLYAICRPLPVYLK